MPYIPNTDHDRALMLKKIGVSSFEELLEPVPVSVRNTQPLRLPPPLSELDLMQEMGALAEQSSQLVCFAGAGVYDHFIPAAVGNILSRPEFATAYTPYQPEVAQGTLQVIYEFQTHICRLTGMDVANASMYDGASAAAEAVLTALTHTGRSKVILAEALNPLYCSTIATYAIGFQAQFVTAPQNDGQTDLTALANMLDSDIACLVISQPNFFGCLEDIERAAEMIHQAGAMLIVCADPISLGLLKPPGEQGADFVVGEGQPLGLPISYGGPLLGFYAVGKKLIRKLPGRLVARTTDSEGRVGFTMTLQTREQHIRRARATSNICTNQALCATTATVYLSLLGKHGFRRVADICLERAHYAAEGIGRTAGFKIAFGAPFHREFVVRCPVPAQEVIEAALARGILAGVDLGRFYPEMADCLLIAVTEKRSYQQIDALVATFKNIADRVPGKKLHEEPCA